MLNVKFNFFFLGFKLDEMAVLSAVGWRLNSGTDSFQDSLEEFNKNA